jgi:hypothetical protein
MPPEASTAFPVSGPDADEIAAVSSEAVAPEILLST